jgi:uncharacterized membrane protein
MTEQVFDKNRVINFSDAVFSIVMTLLILEVGVPSVKDLASNDFAVVLSQRIPDFIGLFVSFMVSALYWLGHLKIFKYVSVVNGRLLWINIFFLLSIVLLPFSTAMFVNGFDFSGPFTFYCLNLSLIAALNIIMLRYVYNKEKGKTGLNALQYRWARARGINVLAVWLLAAIFSGVWFYSRIFFFFLFVIQYFIDRRFKKKLKAI